MKKEITFEAIARLNKTLKTNLNTKLETEFQFLFQEKMSSKVLCSDGPDKNYCFDSEYPNESICLLRYIYAHHINFVFPKSTL